MSKRTPLLAVVGAALFTASFSSPSHAANDILGRVRERGVVRCASVVRPGIAVPSPDGKRWYGMAPDVCHAVAAAVFGDAARIAFRPYVSGPGGPCDRDVDDIVFVSAAEDLEDGTAQGGFQLGPTIVHDALALLVPAAGAATLDALGDRPVCVEPGSPADRMLTRYFAQHAIALREHPFQETDEMRQAYGDGRCAALAGPLTTLASVRADPEDGRLADRVLPTILGDDPIFAATATDDPRWSRIVWWTFGTLVDAEADGLTQSVGTRGGIVPGVPPAVGGRLGLRPTWARDAVAAVGNYGEMFERNLGHETKYDLPRGANALVQNGGSITGLRIE